MKIKIDDEEKGPAPSPTQASPPKTKEKKKKKKSGTDKLHEQIEKLKEELAASYEELTEAEAGVLRAHADADNYKKRMLREKTEAENFAGQSAIEALLPAIDNLEKAVNAAGDDDGDFALLKQGVEMVLKQIKEALTAQGLEKLEVVGEKFDPETSEALNLIETDEVEEDMVIAEFVPGYSYKGRVIRHAKVQVSKKPS